MAASVVSSIYVDSEPEDCLSSNQRFKTTLGPTSSQKRNVEMCEQPLRTKDFLSSSQRFKTTLGSTSQKKGNVEMCGQPIRTKDFLSSSQRFNTTLSLNSQKKGNVEMCRKPLRSKSLDGSNDNLFLDSEGSSFEDLEESFIISPNPKRRMQRRLTPTIERGLSDCEDSDGTCSTSTESEEKYSQPVVVTNSSQHQQASLNSLLSTDSEFEASLTVCAAPVRDQAYPARVGWQKTSSRMQQACRYYYYYYYY
jgi:hypothetical protein